MRKHQGLIEVDSVVNEGTTFFVYLPRKRVLHNAKGKGIGAEMNRIQVIVVEDDPIWLKGICDMTVVT